MQHVYQQANSATVWLGKPEIKSGHALMKLAAFEGFPVKVSAPVRQLAELFQLEKSPAGNLLCQLLTEVFKAIMVNRFL